MTTTELATAYLSLVPSLAGAQREISAQLGAVDVSGPGRKMGANLSKSVTAELKKSLSGLSTVIPSALTAGSQAAAGAVDAAAKAVSAAELDLTSTRKASQAAVERVQAAETKLTELRSAGTATAKQIESAEARLAKAQGSSELASQRTTAAQNMLTQARRSSVMEMANHSDALAREGTLTGRLSLALPALGAQLGVVGQSFRNVGASITDAGKNITTKFTLPAVAAAGAVGAIFVTKGFARLVAIDTARAKLTALGHDANSVQSIMTNALNSVKGTAFGLGDAAGVAASVVAAGVKPGKDLERTLKLVGDAAAIAGTDLGSLGAVFNKVAASGKAQGDVLAQLTDAQIPIIQALADEIGVTGEEVYKLASDGKINFETFQNAVERAVGGSAKIMGETSFVGALDNVWAAVGRLGAAFLDAGGEGGGFFSQIKPLMAEFTAALDEMTPLAIDFGVRFGESFTEFIRITREGIDVWKGLPGPVQSAALAIAGVVAASGPLLIVAGAMASSIGSIIGLAGSMSAGSVKVADFFGRFASGFGSVAAANSAFSGLAGTLGGGLKAALTGVGTAFGTLGKAMFTNPIGIVITSITALVGLLTVFFTQTETGKNAWASLMTFMESTVAKIGPVIESMLAAVGPIIETVLGTVMSVLGSIATAVMPVFQQIGTVLLAVFDVVSAALIPMFNDLMNVVTPLLGLIGDTFMAGITSSMGILMPMFASLVPVIMDMVSQLVLIGTTVAQIVVPMIAQIGETFALAFGMAMEMLLPVVAQLVTTLVPVIGDLLGALLEVGATLISTLLPVFSSLVAAVVPLVAQLVGELLPVVGQLVLAILPLVASIIGALVPAFLMIVEVVVALLAVLMPVVSQLIAAVLPVIVQVIAAIVPLIATIIGALVPAIVAVVQIFATLLAAIMPLIAVILSILIPVITQIIGAIVPLITILLGVLVPVIEALVPIITTVFTVIAGIISSVMTVIQGIIMTVTALISGNWAGVWDGIKMVFSGIWDLIVGIVMGAINIVMSVITGTINVIKGIWDSIWGAIGATVTRIWTQIVDGITMFVRQVEVNIGRAMNFIGAIPDQVLGFFVNIGTTLLESGKSLVQGFIDGITAGFENAKTFVSDGLSGIRDLFPFSPAKEGPFSGRGWVAYSGLSVGETFAQSVASSLSDQKSGIVSALGGIQSEFDNFDGTATASIGVDRFGDAAFARNAQTASYDFAAGEAELARAGGVNVTQHISGDGLPAGAVAEVATQKVADLFRR